MKKLFLFTFLILLVVATALAEQEARESAINLALNQSSEKQTTKSNLEDKTEVPEWLKRTNFAISVGTDEKLKYFLETIQPLFGTQDKDIVLFNQSRISERSQRPTYNIGIGGRRIFKDTYLLGLNSFYDYQELGKHSRGGVGIEVFTDKGLEARANSYIAISHEHLVAEDTGGYNYEEVANGFDAELGLPVPYLPCLKLYGGGNWYNFQHFKNKYGWKGRLEFTPLKYSRINFELFNDTKTEDMNYRVEGALTLGFTSFAWRDILKDIKGAKTAYPKIDLRERVLDRVIRDFDITVIKSTKTRGGLTVEAGRSG